MAHEIGHAMGFNHEQSRDDRDEYVDVFLENLDDAIPPHNYAAKPVTNNFGLPYDYLSVMHYGATVSGLSTFTIAA